MINDSEVSNRFLRIAVLINKMSKVMSEILANRSTRTLKPSVFGKEIECLVSYVFS